MNRLVSRLLLPFLVLGTVLGFNACGDDPVAPPEPTGNSTITVMHANPSVTTDVLFKLDTATLARIGYGATAKASVRNGNRKIDVRALDGSQLASSELNLDSTVSDWVIFSGTLAQRESFRVQTKKITPASTNAAVRVVNASNNAGPVNVRIGDINGTLLTQNAIAYKGSSDYVSVPVATTTMLVITKTNTNPEKLLDVPTVLQAGKSYTVVIYGSADAQADPSVRLTSKVIED